jgi:hypothetical protein
MPGLLLIALAAVLIAGGAGHSSLLNAAIAARLNAAIAARAAQPDALTLEIRAFNGAEDVTGQTRMTVHRAGERKEALPHTRSGDGRVALQVPAGIYDVQAIHEREGRVVNIRWANRLVVMPYPDEAGHHLEVINFRNGFGALQLRGAKGMAFDASLYNLGKHDKPIASPITTAGYTLFIVPAGSYDLQVRARGKTTWQTNLDVPLDRTRLSVIE